MISEIDINDWNRSEQPVKLYEVPRNSVVALPQKPEQLIDFKHIDGMYSFCYLFGTTSPVHLAAWEDVFVWSKK